MKKSFIIYALLLSISFFISYSSQAQQQKKPSERSFAAEISKIKTIQATRNQKISQMQQPTENTAIPVSNKSTTDARPNQANNTTKSTEKKQAEPATKPSSSSMRQPKKPVASRS